MSVEIKTSKRITPKIYAYITPTVISNNGWVKIGYTERQVEQRIKEQTHTANIEANILWSDDAVYMTDPDKGKVFKDHDFHHFLKHHEVERRPKTEWFYFNGNPEKSKDLFEKFIHHDVAGYQVGKGQDYTLRREQEEAVSQTMAYVSMHSNGKFLWNAKPRFGKTLATYELIQRMEAKQVLIVTNRPAIANSWFDDFDNFIAGKTNYKFVSESDTLKNRPTMTRKEYISAGVDEYDQIAFISLQDLKGSSYLGGNIDKLRWVTQISWDLLVIDEAHEGVDTFKTDVVFDQIKRRFTLHLSGTPFKALAKGEFREEQIFNWSYADEQEAKQQWVSESELENPYEVLPQLNLFTYQMSRMIQEKVTEGTQIGENNVDYAFDLNEFFKTNESGKFIYERDVRKWLDTLSSNEKYPFSTKELRNELKHTFWLLDRVASAKALKELLENHPIYENYKIILAAGKERDAEETDNNKLKMLDRVRKAIRENDKTITLSVGQLTTGVTIPEWTGVLMLANIKSPALYMQAAFRAQNAHSWTDSTGRHFRKEKSYVFDFAPERTLILFEQFANNLSLSTVLGRGTSDAREDNIRKLLNFFPVIAEDREGKMIEIDAKSVLTIPSQIKATEVIKRGFMSNLLFDNIAGIFQATQTVLDILSELPVVEQGKVTVTPEEKLDFSDIQLDINGDVLVPQERMEYQQTRLFGDKVYQLGDTVSESFEKAKNETAKNIANKIVEAVAPVIAEELDAEYQLKTNERQAIEKQIKKKIENQVQRYETERKIAEQNIKDDYKAKLKQEKDKIKKKEIEKICEQEIEESNERHKEKLEEGLKKAVEEMPREFVEQVEIKRAQQRKANGEEMIRGHLRGFARTIPSFIMAYGDTDLRLDNFDQYVPENVFLEVTGITVNQFRYLRDGGKDFAGHLFDRTTFDEAIQEFLRKKTELANYFENLKEDIFEYIPPQKTNQIFTPKRVVKRMVDDLERENPGIFDDPEKTFIDLYMKSGLYIAELVKRFYNSEGLQKAYPNREERLKHILENQVYGFAPTSIIYRIALNYIFGELSETISRKNFIQVDTVPIAKEGKIQELVDRYFGQ